MYLSFIRTLLEYSDIVWKQCNQRDTNDLKKKYKLKQAELSPGQRCQLQHQHYYRKQGETLEQRRYKHRMITMHKLHNHTAPS